MTSVVIPASWEVANRSQKSALTRDLRERVTPALRRLSPESGAYINEADPSNPYWKHDYYGANYDTLLQIKHKYDPTGLFWCKPCVGWDEFDIVDTPQDEEIWEKGIGELHSFMSIFGLQLQDKVQDDFAGSDRGVDMLDDSTLIIFEVASASRCLSIK